MISENQNRLPKDNIFFELSQDYQHFRSLFTNQTQDFSFEKTKDAQLQMFLQAFELVAQQIKASLDPLASDMPVQLMSSFFPTLYAPLPPLAIVQFSNNSDLRIPPKTSLFLEHSASTTLAVHNIYPVQVVPLELSHVEFTNERDCLHFIEFELTNQNNEVSTLAQMDLESLPVYVANRAKASFLFDFIFLQGQKISFSFYADGQEQCFETTIFSCLDIMGFGLQDMASKLDTRFESVLCLLKDFFAYPEKFMFFSINFLQEMRAIPFQKLKIRIETLSLKQIQRQFGKEDFELFCSPVVQVDCEDSIVCSLESYFHKTAPIVSEASQCTQVSFANSANLFLNSGYCVDVPHILDGNFQQDSLGFSSYPLSYGDDSVFYFNLINLVPVDDPRNVGIEIETTTTNEYLSDQVPLGNCSFIYSSKKLPVKIVSKFSKIDIRSSFGDSFYLFLSFAGSNLSFQKDLLHFFDIKKKSGNVRIPYDTEKIVNAFASISFLRKEHREFQDGRFNSVIKKLIEIVFNDTSHEGASQYSIYKLIIQTENFSKLISKVSV